MNSVSDSILRRISSLRILDPSASEESLIERALSAEGVPSNSHFVLMQDVKEVLQSSDQRSDPWKFADWFKFNHPAVHA